MILINLLYIAKKRVFAFVFTFFKMRGGVIVKEGLEYAAKMDMNRH